MTDPTPVPELHLRLPHGEGFRFVDRVLGAGDGQAHATWTVRGSEPFFAAHFPGNPLVPGVLLIEALAQTAGFAAPDAPNCRSGGLLVHAEVRFRAPVRPPATIHLHARLSGELGELRQFEVRAEVGGQVVASGSVALRLQPDPA